MIRSRLLSLRYLSSTSSRMAGTKNAAVVIAMQGFQDKELAGVVQGLEQYGWKYDLCGKEKDKEAEGKLGGKKMVNITMDEATPDKYDRVAFIGGPGAHALAKDEQAISLAKRFSKADRVVGAICVAPTILAAAGLLKGKKATVFDREKTGAGEDAKFLSDHGALIAVDIPVVVTEKIVTGFGPDAAEEFGKTFATM